MSIIQWYSTLRLGIRWWFQASRIFWIVWWYSWVATLINKAVIVLFITHLGPRVSWILLYLKSLICLSHWVLLVTYFVALFLLRIQIHILNWRHDLRNIDLLCLHTLLSKCDGTTDIRLCIDHLLRRSSDIIMWLIFGNLMLLRWNHLVHNLSCRVIVAITC